MAQGQGAQGPGDDGPEATGNDVPEARDVPHAPAAAPGPETTAPTAPTAPTERAAAERADRVETPESPEHWGRNGQVGDGRYRLTGRLGRGGMADVFAAEDVRLGRLVAVKLLRPDLAEDAVAKARFTREAQSVAGLNHHAVVAVYDSGEEELGGTLGAVPYIVMELVNGHTIRELLNLAEPRTAEQALSIVAGVLEALAYSHQHGIVHRDIKPANVIITETGSVKVMDFGIARALHGTQSTMTQTGMVMGTPQYLSPEQALGKAVDTRSDLYAVGCLIFELLTQRPPFIGETPLSVVYQHVQDTPRLPSEITALSPPELDGLVMRSLAKDPDDRFQSAEEMRSLVLYAARMLQTHGSHTAGLWSTGSVTADTPALGTPAMGRPGAGRLTAPLLLGEPGPATGDPDKGAVRPGRLRYALIALLVLCAVTVGAWIAVNSDGDGQKSTPSPEEQQDPPPADDQDEPATSPPDEGDEDPTDQGDPSTPDPPWTPEPEPDPTQSETEDPATDGGTTEGDTEGEDGGTTEGADEGADGGTTDSDTDGGTDEGTTEDPDPTDPGGETTDPGGETTDPGGDITDPTDPTEGDAATDPGGALQGATSNTTL